MKERNEMRNTFLEEESEELKQWIHDKGLQDTRQREVWARELRELNDEDEAQRYKVEQ
jgi:hypothetical protein